MSYTEKTIGSIGVEDEGNWGQKTGITVKVDSLDKATIRFGDSYTLRITEEDVDALRRLLNTASVQLMAQRNKREELSNVGRREGNGEGREWNTYA
jgi:hypothetical protein